MAGTTAPFSLIGTAVSSSWTRQNIGRFGSALVEKSSNIVARGGVVHAPGNPLGVTMGGGRDLIVKAGVAVIATPASQGSLIVFIPSDVTLTCDPANGTNPRYDLVVLEIDDIGTADSVGQFRIVKGVAGSNPAIPSTNWLDPSNPVARNLNNGGWIPLGAAYVPASAGSGTVTAVTDRRETIVAAGGIKPVDAFSTGLTLAEGSVFYDKVTKKIGVNRGGTTPQLLHPGVMRFHGQAGPALAGTSPTWPFDSTELLVQHTHAVVNLNSSGDADVDFPSPFPNGVISVVIQNGDLNARVGCYCTIYPNATTLTKSAFRAYMQGGGTAPAGPFRVHMLAIGW